MRHQTTHVIGLRRKRQGKTNYRKRLGLLKSGKPRLVIRITNRDTIAQIIRFEPAGDRIIVAKNAKALQKAGWKYSTGNVVSSFLIGLALGSAALQQGIKEAVLDIGLKPSVKASRTYACLKGVLKAGVQVPHDPSVLPSDGRVLGEHIVTFMQQAHKDAGRFTHQFASLSKGGMSPAQFSADVKELMQKLVRGK